MNETHGKLRRRGLKIGLPAVIGFAFVCSFCAWWVLTPSEPFPNPAVNAPSEIVINEETDPFEESSEVFDEPEEPRVRITAPPTPSIPSREYSRNTGIDVPTWGAPGLGQPGLELIADPP